MSSSSCPDSLHTATAPPLTRPWREAQAKTKFLAVKAELEATILASLHIRDTYVVPLFTPAEHLTSHAWSTFNRWVKDEHVGWTTKRRETTAEKTRENKTDNHSKSYFVDVVYQVPDPNKKPKASKKKKKSEEEDDNRKPTTVAEMQTPSPSFDWLQQDLQFRVPAFFRRSNPWKRNSGVQSVRRSRQARRLLVSPSQVSTRGALDDGTLSPYSRVQALHWDKSTGGS